LNRYNILYSIGEDEFVKELCRLLTSSQDYIENYSIDLIEANAIIDSQEFDRALQEIAKIRQTLAQADYRLHDVMNLISASIRVEDSSVDTAPIASSAKLGERLEEVKKNLQSLGMELSDVEIEKLLEGKND
jgi:hypothetical protein